MNSKRLPGKVMLDLVGKPVIWHIYHRLKKCKNLDDVVISTGEYEKNSQICEFAKRNKINFFSGNEKDLISRLYNTAKNFNADAIVRITSDCPLVDPIIVDKLVNEFKKTDFQYDIITNCATHTFPHGLDVEVYSFNILEKMYKQINDVELREWFPIYVQKNSNDFKILEIKNESDLSYHRWTLDYPEDYDLLKNIFNKLYQDGDIFFMNDILELFKNYPSLININSKYTSHRNIDAPKV
jgi:spore coat polysaccharide biosynthesis protein SpsF